LYIPLNQPFFDMRESDKNPIPYWRKNTSFHFSIGLLLSLTLVTTAFEWNFRSDLTDLPIELKETTADPFFMNPVVLPKVPSPKVPVKPILPADPIETDNFTTEDPAEPIIDLPTFPSSDFNNLFDDEEPEKEKVEEPNYELIPAVPKGGMDAFYKYLYKHISYPEHLKSRGMSGKVYVVFEIDEEGKIDKVKILKGFDAALEKEIIRVLKKAPAWIPAQKGNQKVRMIHNIPFSFDLR
jgi:protein TonB